MKDKITVEFTPLQAVMLWRIFNVNDTDKLELLKTEAFKNLFGTSKGGLANYSDLGHVAVKELASTKIWCKMKDSLNDAGIFDIRHFTFKPVVKIGDHTVQFEKDGVRVGCQYVPNETLVAIMKEQKIVIDKDASKS